MPDTSGTSITDRHRIDAGSAVVCGIYARFVLSPPNRTKWLLIASGACFLACALGVEMMGAAAESDAIRLRFLDGATVYWLIVAEETLEMLGLVLLNYTLLSYMEVEELDASMF